MEGELRPKDPDPGGRAGWRVLMVTEAFAGGVYHWLRMVSPLLTRKGFTISIAYWRRDDTPSDEIIRADFTGVRLISMESSGFGKGPLQAIRGMHWVVREVRPSVIHLHSSWAGLVGRLHVISAGVRPGVRIFYSPHCYAFLRKDISPPLAAGIRLTEAVLGRLSRAVTVACGPGEALIARRLGPRVTNCHNGVSVSECAPARGEKPAPASERVIIASGRLVPQKDPLHAIRIAARVLELDRQASFLWVGSGPLEDRVREALSRTEPDIRERMNIVPWMARPEYLYELSQAVIYLHTAGWEGLSLAILEAMALGRPVVVRRNPGCHEVVEEEGCGIVTTGVDDAVSSILGLLTSHDLRVRLGDRGRMAAHDRYGVERMTRDLASLYSPGPREERDHG